MEQWIEADGHGPTLVLLHPGGMGRQIWRPFVERWSPRFRILAPEIAPAAAPSIRRHAGDLGDFLGRHARGPAYLIGASLGANVALHAALAAPELVRGLVLDSAQIGGPPGRALAGLAGLLRIAGRVIPARLAAAMLLRQFAGWDAADRAAIEAELRTIGLRGLAAHIAAHADHDLRGRLGGIVAPTLILAGADDLLTRRGAPLQLKAGIVQAEIDIIGKAGHATLVRQPARFAAAVESFLQRHG
ncbi:MAG TPA: alpha/beta hydrolase [Herpetosiphonaceae bacterium]|nr:alpha/beta hydrolase [Herpetosiphonaceae bacterium]